MLVVIDPDTLVTCGGRKPLDETRLSHRRLSLEQHRMGTKGAKMNYITLQYIISVFLHLFCLAHPLILCVLPGVPPYYLLLYPNVTMLHIRIHHYYISLSTPCSELADL